MWVLKVNVLSNCDTILARSKTLKGTSPGQKHIQRKTSTQTGQKKERFNETWWKQRERNLNWRRKAEDRRKSGRPKYALWIKANSYNFNDFNETFTLLCCNINGVKQKYDVDDVKRLFSKCDILVIMETHFLVRHKCPKKFELIGKSVLMMKANNVCSGRVAVYKSCSLDIKFHVIENICSDTVIFFVESTI